MITGKDMRILFREQLRAFHNAVNERVSKPAVSKEEYAVLYPNRRPRIEVLEEIDELFATLHTSWKSLLHTIIPPSQLSAWRYAGVVLIAMVKGGPTP